MHSAGPYSGQGAKPEGVNSAHHLWMWHLRRMARPCAFASEWTNRIPDAVVVSASRTLMGTSLSI